MQSTPSIRRGLRLASLFALFACAALAADPPPEPDFTELSLEELAAIEVPNVYGASKHEQKITEAPSAVSIVSAGEIRRHGYRTLGAILRSVRGFYVDYDRGYDFIGIRGVNRPNDYGGRILIMVDGHRLNDPLYDTAAGGMDFLLDVDLIERVEVIRGPGSSLYGNNAFFGVINVITRKGRDLDGVELAGSAGSFDTYTGRASYGSRLPSGVELMFSGTLYDSAGNPRLHYPEFSSVNGGVAENMDGGRAKSAFASISWKGISLSTGFVERRKTWPTGAYSVDDAVIVFNDPRFFTVDERAFASLAFERELASGASLLTRAYYDRFRYEGQFPYDYLDPLYPVTLNLDRTQSNSVGGEVQASRTFLGKHRVTAGAEVRRDFHLDQKNFDADPPAVYIDSHESGGFFSLYAQDEVRVSEKLILNGGVRYDRFTTFGETVNPRAAMIYQISKETTFKLLYGQAFRAPNAYESFYESAIDKRNPGLGPETIHSYELVCEQQLDRHWRTTLSVFYNDVRDLIGYREDPEDGLFFFDNLDTIVAKGGEIEAEAQWPGGVSGRASYTYTRTEDTGTGLRLSNSPEHLGKLGVSLPFWKAVASLEIQSLSRRQTVRGASVSGAVLANATLLSRELVEGLEISASVYNLFDRRYSDPVATDFKQDSIEQDGRTFRLRLTGRF